MSSPFTNLPYHVLLKQRRKQRENERRRVPSFVAAGAVVSKSTPKRSESCG